MREIKFRAWNGKEMDYFSLFEIDNDQWYQGQSIMQYTGLKDKNGKEIYEGDIVAGTFCSGLGGFKSNQYQVRKCEVQITAQNGFLLIPQTGDFKYRFYPSARECEVIGNIYENPEMKKYKYPARSSKL